MATTYKKPLKTVVITPFVGDAITATDTATVPAGSQALAAFEAHETVVVVGDDSITYIPFHAIATVVVSVSESDTITKPDAVCGEAESE